jgi:hypothetical protein
MVVIISSENSTDKLSKNNSLVASKLKVGTSRLMQRNMVSYSQWKTRNTEEHGEKAHV